MSLYNEDELTAPNWVNEEFFEIVLRKFENDEDVEIVKIDITTASMDGDHYASIIFRVKVEYKFSRDGPIATKSLIVKTIPDEGYKHDIGMQTRVFETEIDMYANILPKIEKILAQHGDTTKFATKMVYSALQPNKVIILEDLCEQGYDVVRGRVLTENEFKAVYTKLAKLHAVSFMLGQSEEHQLVTKLQDGIFNNSMVLSNEMIASGIKHFIEMLTVHDEFDMYLPKLRAMENDLFTECKRLYRAYQQGAKGEIMVLNHGDFHLNNLMFKFSKKTHLEDILMIDFQVCVFGPSIIDLMYSTFVLMSSEFRVEKRNQLYHHYFEQFVATLKLIKYQGDLPKFADIQMAAIRHRHFALFLLSTFLPISYSKLSQSTEDLKNTKDKIATGNDALILIYRNSAYLDEVRKLLPTFLNAGYLD